MRFAIGGFSCALALLLLAGCGGDNSGGNGSTPAPTPVPTPVAPAPSPTPTSSAVYQVSIGGPAIGSLTFDTNGSGKFHDTVNNVSDLTISTNRKGQFGPGVADQPTGAMLPENPGRVPVKVGALSLDTGFFYMGIVPAMDGVVASPVSQVLGWEHTDAMARNAGFTKTPAELRNFDAYTALISSDADVRAFARKVTAFNFKLLVHAGYEIQDTSTNAIQVGKNLEAVRLQLLDGAVDFNSPSSISAILERSKRAMFTDPAGREAAAQLIARFGEAADLYITSPEKIAQVEYGMRLIVLPEIKWLFSASSRTPIDIARVKAITVDDLMADFQSFSDIPKPNTATGKFFGVVDWLPWGPDLKATSYQYVNNDIQIDFAASVDPLDSRVTAGRVPAKYAQWLTVTLGADDAIIIRRTGQQPGIGWFEYDVRNKDGLTSTSRAYLELYRQTF